MALAPRFPTPPPHHEHRESRGFWGHCLGGGLGRPCREDRPCTPPSVLAQARGDRHPPSPCKQPPGKVCRGEVRGGGEGSQVSSWHSPAFPMDLGLVCPSAQSKYNIQTFFPLNRLQA